jgi:ribosomal protein S18 acetylase RimI-like enzyme
MRIRSASEEDIPAIARVHVESWKMAYRGIVADSFLDGLSYPKHEARHQRLMSQVGAIYFVAEMPGDGIVGFLSGGPEPSGDLGFPAELYAIYMLEEHRRHGIGLALVRQWAARLRQVDMNSALVWVLAENTPAKAFYERLGARYLRESTIEIGHVPLRELAYGWDDLSAITDQVCSRRSGVISDVLFEFSHLRSRIVLATSPRLQLETLFCLNSSGRITSTREPQPSCGPSFILIRGASTIAWAVRADVHDDLAGALDALAAQEPPSTAWDRPPLHARRYQDLLGGQVRCGPAFAFPQRVDTTSDTSFVDDEALLERHFSGWVAGEIAAGRGPVMALSESGDPVSVCFCARRSPTAAEAGVETAAPFRGRGYAPRVTAAWANAVRAIGLTPIYSTDWENQASLSVAHKLKLIPFATDWSIS